jgi:hypothetical protein
MRLWMMGLAAALACGQAPGFADEREAARNVSLLIRDVTIVDPETRRVLPARDVYVDRDRIVAVNAHDAGTVSAGKAVDIDGAVDAEATIDAETTLEGGGRFLLPGLMDMHAHVGLPRKYALAHHSFDLFIAHGVTAIRDPIGDCANPAKDVCLPELRELGRQVESGERVGPRLVSLSSPKIWGPDRRASELPADAPPFYFPATRAEGRELARFLKARGVDSVKLTHMIHPEGFRGLAAEAQRLPLEIGGHPPYAFPLIESADMGIRVFDHFIYVGPDCSRGGKSWHADVHALLSKAGDGIKPHPPLQRITLDEYDADLCRHVMTELARRDVYITTTLQAFAWLLTQDVPADRHWVSPGQHDAWLRELRDPRPMTEDWQRSMSGHALALIKMANDAGVKLMLGTDAHAVGMVPGISVHEEMELLARAGVTPMEILRMATTVPARYLRKASLFGGASVGKIADLVLLDRDPLTDIAHTRSISSVVFGGKVFDRAELDALLKQVDQRVLQSAEGSSR